MTGNHQSASPVPEQCVWLNWAPSIVSPGSKYDSPSRPGSIALGFMQILGGDGLVVGGIDPKNTMRSVPYQLNNCRCSLHIPRRVYGTGAGCMTQAPHCPHGVILRKPRHLLRHVIHLETPPRAVTASMVRWGAAPAEPVTDEGVRLVPGDPLESRGPLAAQHGMGKAAQFAELRIILNQSPVPMDRADSALN